VLRLDDLPALGSGRMKAARCFNKHEGGRGGNRGAVLQEARCMLEAPSSSSPYGVWRSSRC
jgi:hypothetical protein